MRIFYTQKSIFSICLSCLGTDNGREGHRKIFGLLGKQKFAVKLERKLAGMFMSDSPHTHLPTNFAIYILSNIYYTDFWAPLSNTVNNWQREEELRFPDEK